VSTGGTPPCKTVISNTVMITVYLPLDGGKIGTAPFANCYGIMPLILSIDATPSSGGSGNANHTYQWQSSTDGTTWTPLGVTTQNCPLNSPLTQTLQYRREVTDALGCGTAYSDTIEITVYSLPIIYAGTTELCLGNTTKLFPSTDGTWASDNSGIVSVSGNIATAISIGTAKLTYTSTTTTCSESIDITVKDFPIVAETTGDKVVCIGKPVQLSNTASNGVWRFNNANVSFSDPTANPITITGVSAGNTFVSYTVSDGACETTITFRLKVIPITPPPRIIIGIER
jgi:hypothetical protein